jgi:hypothetical protein
MTRLALGFAAALFLAADPLGAQGLPPYSSMNPMINTRSGLATQPYVARGRKLRVSIGLDYASTDEYTSTAATTYLLDAELLRAEVTLTRELGTGGTGFLLWQGSVNGAYAGFMDGFFIWYHDLFGFPSGSRKIRPRNRFAYELDLADGHHFTRTPSDAFLGDMRLGLGLRHSAHWQTVASVTLPTGTGPEGFKRGVPSINAITTLRSDFGKGFTYEGTLGAGFTASHGELVDLQHTTFLMVSQGLRGRLAGPLHLYGNLIYHSALYHDTGTPALDRRELSIDLGGMLKFKRGPEWLLGLVEDLEPSGPAIDATFRFGARW